MNITNYINYFDDGLSQKECNEIINLFETNTDKQEKVKKNGYPNFTELNLSEHFNGTLIHENLYEKTNLLLKTYIEQNKIKFFPPNPKFEQFRIKKYKNNGEDRFDEHIDACDFTTKRLPSCRRYLTLFWYLNDVEEGGETLFTTFDIKVKCKTGRILIFPPLWMYPHAGLPPKSNNKYIVGTYLLF